MGESSFVMAVGVSKLNHRPDIATKAQTMHERYTDSHHNQNSNSCKSKVDEQACKDEWVWFQLSLTRKITIHDCT